LVLIELLVPDKMVFMWISHRVFKLSSAVAAILVGGLKCQTLFWFLAHLAKGHVSYCHQVSSVVVSLAFHILIFSSETTRPIATKLWWNQVS
jgi:hypothetical protein